MADPTKNDPQFMRLEFLNARFKRLMAAVPRLMAQGLSLDAAEHLADAKQLREELDELQFQVGVYLL